MHVSYKNDTFSRVLYDTVHVIYFVLFCLDRPAHYNNINISPQNYKIYFLSCTATIQKNVWVCYL